MILSLSRQGSPLLALAAVVTFSCASTSSSSGGEGGEGGEESSSPSSSGSGPSSSATGAGGGVCGADVAAPDEELPGATDPAAGMFTLDEALAELPEGPGPLRAVITTEKGEITCELQPEKAPNGVANFVGLIRGRRPWQDPTSKKWVKRKFYDGLTFHRIIDGFVAQGGDPLGTGFGGPGYKFADEISDLKHVPGALAYANSGANTNGSQFYITETAQPSLDGKYTVLGACTPMSVIEAITSTPTDAGDKPLTPIHTQTVVITRCAPAGAN